MTNKTQPEIVVITGLSGAGRTEAMHAFEDLGYYVSDNLPPKLIAELAKTVGVRENTERRLAVVCDLRSQGLFDELLDIVSELNSSGFITELLFLDCSNDVLEKRYAFTRRKNPIAQHGESTSAAIQRERELLLEAKKSATFIVDTTQLNPHELRKAILAHYSQADSEAQFEVSVFSFGFRYGQPNEADMVADVRFLPNPYWDESLRDLNGQDEPIQKYVLEAPLTHDFLEKWFALLQVVLDASAQEGRASFSIGIGCTGGQHRSVVVAEKTAVFVKQLGYRCALHHKQLGSGD